MSNWFSRSEASSGNPVTGAIDLLVAPGAFHEATRHLHAFRIVLVQSDSDLEDPLCVLRLSGLD